MSVSGQLYPFPIVALPAGPARARPVGREHARCSGPEMLALLGHQAKRRVVEVIIIINA